MSRSSRKATVAKSVSLGRPRSRGRMPSLVGDSGQVLGVLGWALTGIRNLPLCCNAVETRCQRWLCEEQNCEFFYQHKGGR